MEREKPRTERVLPSVPPTVHALLLFPLLRLSNSVGRFSTFRNRNTHLKNDIPSCRAIAQQHKHYIPGPQERIALCTAERREDLEESWFHLHSDQYGTYLQRVAVVDPTPAEVAEPSHQSVQYANSAARMLLSGAAASPQMPAGSLAPGWPPAASPSIYDIPHPLYPPPPAPSPYDEHMAYASPFPPTSQNGAYHAQHWQQHAGQLSDPLLRTSSPLNAFAHPGGRDIARPSSIPNFSNTDHTIAPFSASLSSQSTLGHLDEFAPVPGRPYSPAQYSVQGFGAIGASPITTGSHASRTSTPIPCPSSSFADANANAFTATPKPSGAHSPAFGLGSQTATVGVPVPSPVDRVPSSFSPTNMLVLAASQARNAGVDRDGAKWPNTVVQAPANADTPSTAYTPSSESTYYDSPVDWASVPAAESPAATTMHSPTPLTDPMRIAQQANATRSPSHVPARSVYSESLIFDTHKIEESDADWSFDSPNVCFAMFRASTACIGHHAAAVDAIWERDAADWTPEFGVRMERLRAKPRGRVDLALASWVRNVDEGR
ncbi:hypothetical protein HMN09_00010000 [Mycena chlorophos]|uniref:Uncharacterized protein n=1 Tax=Mycena chlorophos TaxID=658473 RepID=A0A8H6WPG9_MYCCL|nr:hypothetical protein HMN09_00010000 [Mycena chlorophos]